LKLFKKSFLFAFSLFLSFTLNANTFSKDEILNCVNTHEEIMQNKDSLNRISERLEVQVSMIEDYKKSRKRLQEEINSAGKKRYSCNPNIQWGSEACNFAENNYNRLVDKWNKGLDRGKLLVRRANELQESYINKRKRLAREEEIAGEMCFNKPAIEVDDFKAICKNGVGKNSFYCKRFKVG